MLNMPMILKRPAIDKDNKKVSFLYAEMQVTSNNLEI